MKRKNKLIALAIALVFALSLAPGVAFAAEPVPEVTEEIPAPVAVPEEETPLEESPEQPTEQTLPDQAEAVEALPATLPEEYSAVEEPAVGNAQNLQGLFGDPTAETAAALLPAPKNFKAVMSGSNAAKLSWSGVAGAEAYAIYRGVGAGSLSFQTLLESTARSYTDYGLNGSSLYFYIVCAVGSDMQRGQPTDAISPNLVAAPTGLAAKSAGYNSIGLSWKALSGASEYRIYRSTSATSDATLAGTVAGNKTSFTDIGLTTGKAYYYSIFAMKNGRPSNASSMVFAKPTLARPGSFSVRAAAGSKIRLSWSKSAGASGYIVYRATSANGSYASIKTVGASAIFTDTGLTAGKTYYYKVVPYRTISGSNIKGTPTAVLSAKAVK